YSAGESDVFVAKYSSTGAFLWAVSMGGAGYDHAYGIAVDSAGDVDVAGGFMGTAQFGSQTLTATGSGYNPFVVQLNATTGNVLWATNPYPVSGNTAWGIAVDSAGNAYVAGQDTSSNNAFAAKVSSNGTVSWVDQITPNYAGVTPSVAVSGNNAYFEGSFGG